MATIGIHPRLNRKECAQELNTFLMRQHQLGYTVALGNFTHLIPPGSKCKVKAKPPTKPLPPYNGGGAAA